MFPDDSSPVSPTNPPAATSGAHSKRAGRGTATRTLIAVALVGALVGGPVDRYAGGPG